MLDRSVRTGKLSAGELRALAAAAEASRPGLTGRAGIRTSGGTSEFPDDGWFPAVVTDVTEGYTDQYQLEEVEHDGQEVVTNVHGQATDPATPAYCLNGQAAEGDVVLARRSRRLGLAFEFLAVGGGAGGPINIYCDDYGRARVTVGDPVPEAEGPTPGYYCVDGSVYYWDGIDHPPAGTRYETPEEAQAAGCCPTGYEIRWVRIHDLPGGGNCSPECRPVGDPGAFATEDECMDGIDP